MTDIFDEVEEDLRRERLKKVWDRFAPLIVGGAVLIVAGVGGWRVYQHLQTQWAAEAGDRYRAAMQLSNEGKEAEAAAAFAALGQDGTSGYRTIGRLRAAAELAERDPKAAIAAYESFANDTSEPQALRDVARLRAGYLLVDNGTYAEARRTVESLVLPGNPFRHGAREVLGLAAWKADNLDEARRWLEALVSDAEAPASARQRGDLVLDILNAPGPPPTPTPAPAPGAPLDLTPPNAPAPSVGIPSLTTGTPELPANVAPSLDAPSPDASGHTPGTAVPTPSDQTPSAAPAFPTPAPAETPAPSAPAAETPAPVPEVAPASPTSPEPAVPPPSSEPVPSPPAESTTPPSAAAPTQGPSSATPATDSATPSPETPPTVATQPPPAETSPPPTAPAQ
jgi:hypothetical protein